MHLLMMDAAVAKCVHLSPSLFLSPWTLDSSPPITSDNNKLVIMDAVPVHQRSTLLPCSFFSISLFSPGSLGDRLLTDDLLPNWIIPALPGPSLLPCSLSLSFSLSPSMFCFVAFLLLHASLLFLCVCVFTLSSFNHS